ncbi:hypothetical protein KSS87_005701 [Heliosperma pusillum]|nr:hypothetical protein KSS87_005701 [Heliosperma pusillum]
MQGIDHQQQQQLAALISAALGKAAADSSSDSSHDADSDESIRVSAIKSLHRFIIYPPNSLLLSHSPAFLFQALSQLISHPSYSVRESAATAYGALSAVLCSMPRPSTGHSLVNRYIAWALPLLNNVTATDGSLILALHSLREFLSVAEAGATHTYAFSILKACRQLLEDDRITLHLLPHLLPLFTLLSLKFYSCFRPHFVDIVDLLLGWAMLPDLPDSDRRLILATFLHFQNYWPNNLHFPLGLLSKFLGDMDVLLKDDTPATLHQFNRLLALFSCFSAVLQSTASGLLEMHLLHQIIDPLINIIPQLMCCLSFLGKKFGWSKWIQDSWRCLTLLAEILGERFAVFYPLALDVLFQSLHVDGSAKPMKDGRLSSFQIHGVLKTNLQLLSLQKLGLLPSSVHKILQWDAPISQLRLHPNHLVTSSSAATYVFLLQHGNDEVVQHSINLLFDELGMLSGILRGNLGNRDGDNVSVDTDTYSKLELCAFIKFDVKVLLSCVFPRKEDSLFTQSDTANLLLQRSEKVASFLMSNLFSSNSSVVNFLELRVTILEALGRLTSVELLSRCSIELFRGESAEKTDKNLTLIPKCLGIVINHLNKYSNIPLNALDVNSPIAVKMKAFDWISKFCEDMTRIYERLGCNAVPCDDLGYSSAVWTLASSVLGAGFDREPSVRFQVAVVFGLLLRAELVHPKHFHQMAEFVVEKIGDTDANVRGAFVRHLSHFLPVAVFLCGASDSGMVSVSRSNFCKIGNQAGMHWRSVFALKQLPQRLQPQQLVSILSYISQRWKAPLSSWIQRLILHCNSVKDLNPSSIEETASCGGNSLWRDAILDADVLERVNLVNNLAGVWWAIHEAARYCTTTRLRTNLGGPTQTFAALERMLLDVAHMLQLVTEHNDGGLSIMGSNGARLLPMRLLLDFVEALKKNVYNAYEGSSVLPSASRQSSLFFRANRKVCEEWFSRICEPMMNAGLALECHDAVIQYSSLRLQELKNTVASTLRENVQMTDNQYNMRSKSARDVMCVVRCMSLALSKKHESAALIGLQKWAHLTFSHLLEERQQAAEDSLTSGPFWWISGLVHQANGEYEKAAAFFTLLLQTEEFLSSVGADGIQFTIKRVIESYAAISDWRSLDSWLLELQNLRAKHTGKSYSGAMTTTGNEINAIHALSHFDEGDIQAAWASLDLTPKSSSELTLDPKLALQRSEQMLLQAMLYKTEGKLDLVQDELQKAKSMLDETLTVLPLDGFHEAAPVAIHLRCIKTLEEYCSLNKLQEKPQQLESILNPFLQAVHLPMCIIQQDCNPWLKLFRVYRTILPSSFVTLELCKNLMGLARKQGNLGLANHFKNHLRDQINSCLEVSNHQFLMSSLTYEEILLMYSENKFMDAFTHMWSYVKSCFVSLESLDFVMPEHQLKAKACLKLSNWLRRDYGDFSVENVVLDVVTTFNQCGGGNESSAEESMIFKPNTRLVIEELAGIATKLATRLCPTMGKSWISYASWCFSQAKESLSPAHGNVLHSCSLSPILAPELPPKRFSLTEDEISRVRSIISQFLCSNDTTALVGKVVNVIEAAAAAPGAENFACESLLAVVSSQLQRTLLDENVQTEENITSSSLNDLVDVWWSLRRRRVSLFGHAAHGFVQYLSYSSTQVTGSPSINHDLRSFNQKSGSLILRATLYILHILLNYGLELKDTLEPALAAVPLSPWQELTPQLFARLGSHPEPKTRKQLEGLVMILAKSTPWSVVYPTLVDLNASDDGPSEELQHILDCLMKLYPRLVQDVKLMIYELGNVTVLWEELWLSTLQDLHGDVVRRINLLKEEAARISGNITLSHSEKVKINAAKYSAMMAPIVVALERRLSLVSRKAETPHERWFQDEYKEPIKSAILAFKTPPPSASSLGDVWRPFDSIAASLASYQRKSAVSLREVAPQLACLSSSDVPMPGLETQFMLSESERDFGSTSLGIVTIASFSEQVTILSTKTKPKKLVILGSDGGKYTYLLKGREDLRLDARIMQLLQAVNGFLHSYAETRSRSIGIRYYSVTPISGRAGLIQWVDNVVSIYSSFKAWQQRDQLAQLLAAGGGNVKNAAPPPVPRPSDMFYGKIIPALKEKGIKRVISRRDWPQEVKLKVLLDLMKQTPRQLLHQELWCASEGFRAFSAKLKRYSGSLAAMSMVGHILGLGDRHLDNILIDFFTGDIVHIDYNVCFDKGQRLKVPEIVPFRLTQILEAALGLTGLEGVFRSNCEVVLGVLRRNKDILLMLLEVFVWDPLVEWTRGDFHDDDAIGGEERKGMELAVSLSLFASRVQEIRVPLQVIGFELPVQCSHTGNSNLMPDRNKEHHDLLLATAPAVEYAFERFLNILNQYELVSANYLRADQERSTLALHETSAQSIVAEATSRSENTRTLYEVQSQEFAQAKAVVAEKAQEASSWLEQHVRFLDALRNGSIPEIKGSVKLSKMEDALSLISAVSVAGVPLTVVPEPTQAQCLEIDREISQLISELDLGVSCAVTSLQAFSLALQRFLPLNYLATSPVHSWAQILQLSVNTLSLDMLSLARRQAGELVADIRGNAVDYVRHSHDDLCLKTKRYALEIKKLEEEYTGLVNSIGSEAELKAKNCLLSVFLKNMQSCSTRNEDFFPFLPAAQFKYEDNSDAKGVSSVKREKTLSLLCGALCSLYDDVKHKIIEIFSESTTTAVADSLQLLDFGTVYCALEEQIEKCVLVVDLFNQLQHSSSSGSLSSDTMVSKENWASIFKTTLISCKDLIIHMTEGVLPELVKSVVSIDSEVIDVFGTLSNIRGSVESALEQLVEVKMERDSLEQLEKGYFLKVGRITEQQLALEEAAMKGRDHLSWEEAEELASQEEACRAQLDQLHLTWNQKDTRISSLIKREADIEDDLVSLKQRFLSLLGSEEERVAHGFRSKALLSTLGKPFSMLESLDMTIFESYGATSCQKNFVRLANFLSSGCQMSEYIWKFKGLLDGQEFFAWKVAVMDSVLDVTIHDVSSCLDQNLGMDQLVEAIKKKLVVQLQGVTSQYIKERIALTFFHCLTKETENLKKSFESLCEPGYESLKDSTAVKRVRVMLEEYCDTHETVRAARSAASLMKRQVIELKEAIRKTTHEIIQMEWMHDSTLVPSQDSKIIAHKFLDTDDEMYHFVLNLSRPNFLERLRSAVSKIVSSIDCLQSSERTSSTAEGQLERAMNWACGGPNSSMSCNASYKSSGIPVQFHDHLKRRRQLLREVQEKATDVMKVGFSILEFEMSRDGTLGPSGKIFPISNGDGRAWQQVYLNALTRLEVTFHSYSRAEQEWGFAQSSLEAASGRLYSASNELSVASQKADSASGDLQSTLLQMRDCASEVSISLSAFSRVARGHTALTSECGSMLGEVLAISNGLHEVHNLGKEAEAMHHSLMDSISKDVTAMTDAMTKERENKMGISPVHGQAIYQSYFPRTKEAFQAFKPLVPSLVSSAKELYSLLTKLAQTASLHAGYLHKAVGGIEGSVETRSQHINLSREDLVNSVSDYEDMGRGLLSDFDEERHDNEVSVSLSSAEDKEGVSAPDSIYSSSGVGSISDETCSSNALSFQKDMEHLSLNSNNEDDGNSFKELEHSETDHYSEMEDRDGGDKTNSEDKTNSDVKPDVYSVSKLSSDELQEMHKEENLAVALEVKEEASSSSRIGAGTESHVSESQAGILLKKEMARAPRGSEGPVLSSLLTLVVAGSSTRIAVVWVVCTFAYHHRIQAGHPGFEYWKKYQAEDNGLVNTKTWWVSIKGSGAVLIHSIGLLAYGQWLATQIISLYSATKKNDLNRKKTSLLLALSSASMAFACLELRLPAWKMSAVYAYHKKVAATLITSMSNIPY